MKKSLVLFVGLLLIDSCVERINIPINEDYTKDLVVDGLITDEPGPYTVKISQAIRIDASLPSGLPVSVKTVTIFDDAGNSEVLEQKNRGLYQTKANGMRGVIGRTYYIIIETNDGYTIESLPEKMYPVGAVDSIYYEFESSQPEDAPTEYGYRIYIDAHNTPGHDSFLRWKFVGTYVVETLPQYKYCLSDACNGSYCPLDCSGYAYVNGELEKGYAYNPKTQKVEYVIGRECTCCRCWVTTPENTPKVNNGEVSREGKFNKVYMGHVPVNYYTFFEKYRVEIIQMSLSRAAFDYWRSVKSQKEAVGSLFQPITGKIPSNLLEKTGSLAVQGIFSASAITKKQIYLGKNTHRAEIYVPKDCMRPPREGAVGEDCLFAFPGQITTRQKPLDWRD